jgi:Glycosyl hydrolase family 79 C-terminal beta domain
MKRFLHDHAIAPLWFLCLSCLSGCSSGRHIPPTPLPTIESFTASSASIIAGQDVTLSWSVTGASSLELSGVSSVSGTSAIVTPAETTTYTLTATNAAGSANRSATITVQQGAPLGTASIDAAKPGAQIPASFLGFSHEWSGPPVLMGPPGNTNPIYRQLVKNLTAYGGGPLLIRIGGNSTDTTTAPTTGVVAPMAQLYADLGAKFTLGVNLGSDDVALATQQGQYYLANMPAGSLEAIEIGNEPDLYHDNGDRPTTYTFADYLSDFATWRTAILPLLPNGVKLMGPSWASTSSLSNLPAFLAQEKSNLSIVSQHYYAGTQCNGNTNPPDYLLQDSAATKGATAVASSVTLTHDNNLPFRMGEMNSISCGGETGVSDIFASALWSIDVMFEFANVGVDGVNFHNGNGGGYSLFQFNTAIMGNTTTYSVASIRPEYYGLLFFQMATANTPKLLPVTLNAAANLKVWATIDAQGVVRIVLINKDETLQGAASVSLAGYGTASVTRLTAANYQATSGISIGGQTFDGSQDGTPQGTAFTEAAPASAGVYSVALAPTSAALLTINPP